jgi:hypothetical protein
MKHAIRMTLALVLTAGLSASAHAADTCAAKVKIAGKAATLTNCAVAMYDSKGVTLFFTEKPLTAEELSTFHLNSYAEDKDSAGKPRTMMHFSFCPAGGKAAPPSPGAVKTVEVSMADASNIMVSRQWVADFPKDKWMKIDSLSGELKSGGRLKGRITGAQKSDGDYSFDATFDVALPAKDAAAGPGCGSD